MQKLGSEIISEIKWEMQNLLEETIHDIKNDQLTQREFGYFFQQQQNEIWDNRLQINYQSKDYSTESNKNKKNQLPDKIFIPRESYLTHLLNVPHMRCIYNIFFAILLILTVHTFVQDYFIEGR